MANRRKLNPSLKTNNDTGFGSVANNYGGRFINKDGTFNLRREGATFFNRFSVFQRMLSLPRWKFISVIIIFSLPSTFCLPFLTWLSALTNCRG